MAHQALPRTLAALTATTTLALALAACGGGDDDDAPEADSSPTVSETVAEQTDDVPEEPADEATPDEDLDVPLTGPAQFRRVVEATGLPPVDGSASTLPEDCSDAPAGHPAADAEVVACDESGVVYRLAPAAVVGGIDDAEAVRPEGLSEWVVELAFDDEASRGIAAATTDLAASGELFAVVLGGQVVSAPSVQSAVTGGILQIAGRFDRARAEEIAAALAADG